MNIQNTCPLCKSTVTFDFISTGPNITSVEAKCKFCGATGKAAVTGLLLAAATKKRPSEATTFAIFAAYEAAWKNIGH